MLGHPWSKHGMGMAHRTPNQMVVGWFSSNDSKKKKKKKKGGFLLSLQTLQLAMGMPIWIKKKEPARLPIYTHIHIVQCPATSMLFTCAHSLSGVVSFRRKEKGVPSFLVGGGGGGGGGPPQR
jgi:hypothetical protein